MAVQSELHTWRTEVKKRDFPFALFGFDALLSDEMIDLLLSVGPIKTQEELSVILSGQWGWEATYGVKLLSKLLSLDIPALTPLSTNPKTRGTKRRVDAAEEGIIGTEKRSKQRKPARRALQTGEYILGLNVNPTETPQPVMGSMGLTLDLWTKRSTLR
jgi:hypothetical protein